MSEVTKSVTITRMQARALVGIIPDEPQWSDLITALDMVQDFQCGVFLILTPDKLP